MHTLLVANRGEIALRIMRTARRMGLETIAVYSDADANAPHVRFADSAVRIGAAPSRESYLSAPALLRACSLSGADTVHPGYGFLSENADFAQSVRSAGLTWVGPSPEAIRAMGLKREARALVGARGVPLVPGFDGGDQSTTVLREQALALGLPVLFKPSAGGGGKGMRIVRDATGLDEAIAAAQREASSAFGDPTLIIEKYLERPRHVEVQLLADHHGNLVHLYERECSIQRRHQKVIEESPSSALTTDARATMAAAALEVARAIDYTNAGTVEFIIDRAGRFYFSEMNTRLQVEHRVTERLVGVDLVELQLRIARGEHLPFTQEDVRPLGHSVECRLYAEDPANDFLPSTGTVCDFDLPQIDDVQLDAGIESGSEVSVHYDPLLAKIIAWGSDRAEATMKLVRALETMSVAGLKTNRAFLARLLRHPAYARGELHTGFIAEHLPDLISETRNGDAAVAATLALHLRRPRARLPSIPSGWRNNRVAGQVVEYAQGERVEYRSLGEGAFLLRTGARESLWHVLAFDDQTLTLESPEGLRQRARVIVDRTGNAWVRTTRGQFEFTELPRFPAAGDAALKGGLIAAMPGRVVRVLVSGGQHVARGAVLLVLEAMKMEQPTRSPAAGVIEQVLVREGDQVTAGQVLAVLKEHP